MVPREMDLTQWCLCFQSYGFVLSVEGRPVQLTPLEFRLLSHLFLNQGQILSQLDLADAIYGINNEHDSNAVEALVARIRRKLGVACIRTQRGFGYTIPMNSNDS